MTKREQPQNEPATLTPPVQRLPVVAIVGRPNVGKSTLFNRLLGQRKAIVEDEPGVTRDRNYGEAAIEDRRVILIDTGGFDPDATDMIWTMMREQVDLAVGEADVIIFMLDTQHGLTHTDNAIYRILEQTKKPVIVAVNKADNAKLEVQAQAEGYGLGVDRVLPIGAQSRRNLKKLRAWIVGVLPKDSPRVQEDAGAHRRVQLTEREEELLATGDIRESEEWTDLEAEEEGLGETESLLTADEPISVAVVGKPNAGKSTLVNCILGKERLLTSNLPGTTRDSIDTWVLSRPRPYLFIDTAGIRKKARISDKVERFSVIRALESVRRADVVVLVVDATQGVTDQDKKIAQLSVQYGKAVIVLVNKWDLITKDTMTSVEFTKEIHYRMPFLDWAPVLYISALTGKRVVKLYDLVERVALNRAQRVRTGACNRTLRHLSNRHQIPIQGTRRPRLYFGSQVEVRPPTFLFFGNEVGLIRAGYQRYLERGFRDAFNLEGVPIRILLRNRQRSPSKRKNPGYGKGSAVQRKRARKKPGYAGGKRKK